MSLEMPHELQWLAYVAGDQWPQGDEDAMWALAQDWYDAASAVKAQLDSVQDVITAADNAYPSGEGRTAIDSALKQLLEGDGSLTALATVLDNLGDVAENMGTEIQYMKIMIISSLAELGLEILLAWIFPPTAPATEAAAIAATRAVMRVVYDSTLGAIEKGLAKLIGSKLANLMIRHIVVSTTLGTGQDLLIQGVQVAQGHRKSIDGLQVAEVAVGAAADGLIGFSPIGTAAHSAMSKIYTKFEVPNTRWKGFFAETGMSVVSGAWAGSTGALGAAIAGMAVYSLATGTNFGDDLRSTLSSPTSVIGGAAGGGLAGLSKGMANFRSSGAFQGAGLTWSGIRTGLGGRGAGTDGSTAHPHDEFEMSTTATRNRPQDSVNPAATPSAAEPTISQEETTRQTLSEDTTQPLELSDERAAELWGSMAPDDEVWNSTGHDLGDNSGLVDPRHHNEADPGDADPASHGTGSGHDWEYVQTDEHGDVVTTRWPTEWELPDTSRFFTNAGTPTYTAPNVPSESFFENPEGDNT